MSPSTTSRGARALDAPAAPTIADAIWNQRSTLGANRERIARLLTAVDRPDQLSPAQAMSLFGVTLEYEPDLILELGRGHGNSTAVLCEAANILGPSRTRVVSLCLTPFWDRETRPRLASVVDRSWYRPLAALRADILSVDYEALFEPARRVLIFWDAHGYDIAECVLGRMLPLLRDKSTTVLLHDMSDARYIADGRLPYSGAGLWRRNDWSGRYLQLGSLVSNVEQAVAVVDFASRNGIALESATHSLRTVLTRAQLDELESLVGGGIGSVDVAIHRFSASPERSRQWTYPGYADRSPIRKQWLRVVIASFSVAEMLRVEPAARRLMKAVRSARYR